MADVLTLVELAKQLKVPVSTARKLVVANKIRGFKVGNRWRVNASDLDAYVAHQRYMAKGGNAAARVAPAKLEGWKTFR